MSLKMINEEKKINEIKQDELSTFLINFKNIIIELNLYFKDYKLGIERVFKYKTSLFIRFKFLFSHFLS